MAAGGEHLSAVYGDHVQLHTAQRTAS
jgi:hypothetical protein